MDKERLIRKSSGLWMEDAVKRRKATFFGNFTSEPQNGKPKNLLIE